MKKRRTKLDRLISQNMSITSHESGISNFETAELRSCVKAAIKVAKDRKVRLDRQEQRINKLVRLLRSAYGFVAKYDNVGITYKAIKEELDSDINSHSAFCHKCQLKRGGKVPKGQGGITISMGTCSMCEKENIGLVPSCDYDWPKEGKKAIFD